MPWDWYGTLERIHHALFGIMTRAPGDLTKLADHVTPVVTPILPGR